MDYEAMSLEELVVYRSQLKADYLAAYNASGEVYARKVEEERMADWVKREGLPEGSKIVVIPPTLEMKVKGR